MITRRVVRLGLCALVVGMCSAAVLLAAAKEDAAEQVQVGEYVISGPHVYRNVALYLIRGKDLIKGENFLTLEEALKAKKAAVRETEDVGELVVDNLSDTDYLYIEYGDIVKGGKQDRVVSADVVVEPGAKGLKVEAFCVESGRWARRGKEAAYAFSGSSDRLYSRYSRYNANFGGSQGKIWNDINEEQGKLGEKVGKSVKSEESPTSLQLTLSDDKVKKAVAGCESALSKAADSHEDVVGYVYAINGKVNTAEIYCSRALFKKMWPKLLKSTALEALSESQEGKDFKPPSAEEFSAFLLKDAKGEKTEKKVAEGARVVITESAEGLVGELDATVKDADNVKKKVRIHTYQISK